MFQQLTRNYHRGCGAAVTNLALLGLRDLHHHLGSRVLYVHLLEYGDTVIGDHDIAQAVHQHLIHTLWPQGSPDHLANGPSSHNIHAPCIPASAPLSPLG